MTYNDYLKEPSSKKITLVEIDTPLKEPWQNLQPGIWFQWLTPGAATDLDDDGNLIHWGTDNEVFYNIGSVNVDGELYAEATSLNNCISTEKSWFYNTATTYVYVHFTDFNPPESFIVRAPGAVIGFTNQIDTTVDNYFEDIYYEPLLAGIPNLTKKKDALFFGILQFQGGTISFNNTPKKKTDPGYFDDFAQRDLYGQPVRIRLSFEGLPYADSKLVYTGRIEDFTHDFTTFKMKIADVRKLLSRKLPVNVLADGTPIPIAFGTVIKAPAYRTSAGNWKFADTTFNAIDATIIVYNAAGGIFGHGGVETDGTFTGADTTEKLTVTFTQSSVKNGLDIISDILENYDNVTFNSTNYDTSEWAQEITNVPDMGIWIGKGKLMTSADVIELVCISSNGIFDVLADGKFTFRKLNINRIPTHEIFEDEIIGGITNPYDSSEYLSSIKIEYSEDLKEKEPAIYTNSDFETEVFGRYRQYKERTFETALTTQADATTLSETYMDISKFIFPEIRMKTKTQNVGLRILDNLMYTYQRQSGKVVIARSRYQTLGISINMSTYEMSIIVKQIEEDDTIYAILDGGTPATDYDFYDGGSPSNRPTQIIKGRTF